MKKFKVGDVVWWSDPDNEFNSGPGTIVKMQHDPPMSDSVIALDMHDGGCVECLRHEIRHYTPPKDVRLGGCHG